ncbi:hypothetical protein FK531_02015 [Rhodococcus spelaei]|uniref:Lipoprotein n=1 Tax=Rhodococcus spelaei TaxID=2546320 RepID=A0A541BRA0_9NOCA|nr:hypothetical protein [Rhodococcus spelaei]TQF74872.1 hypothetical protein FK531_02015 [Rhodococcus spelaei]
MKRTVTALALGATLLLAGCSSDDSSSSAAAETSAAPAATCPADATNDDPTATVIAKTATLPAGVTVDGASTKIDGEKIQVTVRLCGSDLTGDALKNAANAVAAPVKGSLLANSLGVLNVAVVGGESLHSSDFQTWTS